ncbi:hypothetical protein NEUTE2DRAFT_61006 [Neurospora tetrasperma FGSC 2509]|nr:hypothetical protein NEUTE2DRAFT_61006 [Neurospora tetrasperma FGSC 2509]
MRGPYGHPKLSNFATNANKAYKQKIATAVEKHGSASFNKTTRELKDSQGEVIDIRKLAGHAKVKRARRPRQARMQANNANASNATASNTDRGSNANNPNSLYKNYREDGNYSDHVDYSEDEDDDTDVDVDNHDHGDHDDHGYNNHHGNQVGGSAGFPASYHASSEEFRGTSSHQQTNNALASGIDRQGHIPNSLPFKIGQPNALYPSLPRQTSHLSNLNNPHPNTIQANALYSDLPHYNSPLPNSQNYGQQSTPAAGTQNGQHPGYVYPGNDHFVLEGDEYQV